MEPTRKDLEKQAKKMRERTRAMDAQTRQIAVDAGCIDDHRYFETPAK